MSNPHPNATAAGLSGGATILLVWLLDTLGVKLEDEVVAVLTSGVITVVLFIGHNGLRGLLRLIWRGSR